jgi:hypothetical protein
MKLAAVASIVLLTASVALAQHPRVLIDGWKVSWPTAATPQSKPGANGAKVLWQDHDGRHYRCFYTASGPVARGEAAAAELVAAAQKSVDDAEKAGEEILRADITRCDRDGVIGVELKLSMRLHDSGRVVRLHSKLYHTGDRFVQVTYSARRELYDGDAARAFLDSLTAADAK